MNAQKATPTVRVPRKSKSNKTELTQDGNSTFVWQENNLNFPIKILTIEWMDMDGSKL
jgi:hypothetical protein